MNIAWFLLDANNKSTHLFNTVGDLPRAGDSVYIDDFRSEWGGPIRSRYHVISAIHQITRSITCPARDIMTAGDKDRFEELSEWVEKMTGRHGSPGHLDKVNKDGCLETTCHTGEVVLEKVVD